MRLRPHRLGRASIPRGHVRTSIIRRERSR
jgi:hypothetical protein